MNRKIWLGGLAAALALSGCGDTLGEQALIGAGAGAVTAVALEGDPATGVVLGAAGNVAYCRFSGAYC